MTSHGPPPRWRLLVLAMPIIIGLVIGSWDIEQRHSPGQRADFCDTVSGTFSQLLQTSGASGTFTLPSPQALATALGKLDTSALLASMPASLRRSGLLLQQQLPATIRTIRATPASKLQLSTLPPDVVTAIVQISTAYEKRCT